VLESPRWYHGVTANCTTSIYLQRKGNMAWDWRLLFNGGLDRMLYGRKRLDQSQPFETLKQQSLVNEIANLASRENFGDYLRFQLPGYNRGASDQSPHLGKRGEDPSLGP
jgi:hypothetical protein